MRWAGHVTRMGEESLQGFGGKPQGKKRPGKPRRRRENGIRMDHREIVLGSVECIQLAQDRDRWRAVVNTMNNLRFIAT
jgi:hypothetical protein